jgi:hypothetical protein
MESQQNTGCGCGGNRMANDSVMPPHNFNDSNNRASMTRQPLNKSQMDLAALINAVHIRKSKISKINSKEKS